MENSNHMRNREGRTGRTSRMIQGLSRIEVNGVSNIMRGASDVYFLEPYQSYRGDSVPHHLQVFVTRTFVLQTGFKARWSTLNSLY